MQAEIVSFSNIEVEQALLGAVFVNNQAFHIHAHKMKDIYFSDEYHQMLWRKICENMNVGICNPITLKSYLSKDEQPKVGNITTQEYLIRLASEAATVIQTPDYIEHLKELWARREINKKALEIAEYARSNHAPFKACDLLSKLNDDIRTSLGVSNSELTGTLSDTANDFTEIDLTSKNKGMQTELTAFDSIIDDFAKGEMHIIGARPMMGKSALACELAYRWARRGFHGAYFSLEMNKADLTRRMLSRASRAYTKGFISYKNMKSGVAYSGEYGKFNRDVILKCEQDFKKYHLFLDCRQAITVADIKIRCLELHRRGKLDYVIVDHLGLLRPLRDYKGNRNGEVTEISGMLRDLAKELQIPFIVLCQLNRDVAKGDIRPPALPDLRDSGSIEQDAYSVTFIHREYEYYRNKNDDKSINYMSNNPHLENKMSLVIAKNRGGEIGKVDVWCDLATNTIRNLDRQDYL